MNYQTACSAMLDVFYAGWTETEIAYDNLPFDPDNHQEFVRLSIVGTGGEQVSKGPIGKRWMRQTATLIVQVFVSENDGTYRSNELCQKAREIYYSGAPGVVIRDHGVRGGRVDSGFFQQNVYVNFQYDEEG